MKTRRDIPPAMTISTSAGIGTDILGYFEVCLLQM